MRIQIQNASRFQRMLKAILVLGNKMNGVTEKDRKRTVKVSSTARMCDCCDAMQLEGGDGAITAAALVTRSHLLRDIHNVHYSSPV